jgi:precorrin-8X/cobalt-precorrin-8 methylmutase
MDKGLKIEQDSFGIIDSMTDLSYYTETEKIIVRKLIHTTGDTEFAKIVRIHEGAVKKGVEALKAGKPVICDVTMVTAGITSRYLKDYGNEVLCFINEPEVMERAKAENLTRAETAMAYAAEKYPDAVYAVGNAPTALLKLIQLSENGLMNPSFVAGLPVGFVKAADSKGLLTCTNLPYVTNLGTKGGSPCAATVINGLFVILADLSQQS